MTLPPIPAGEHWTDEQWQAVVHRNSATLVAAAAGSGKTSVLVRRILSHLTQTTDPVDVDDLVVVTFTKAAAAEMRQRLADRLAAEIARRIRDPLAKRDPTGPAERDLERQIALLGRAQISTLHSFCLALLRQNFHQLDLDPGFSELGDHEARLLQLEVLEEVFAARYGEADDSRQAEFLGLVDRFADDGEDEGLAELVLDLHETTRSLLDPEDWLATAAGRFDLAPTDRLEDLAIAGTLLSSARQKLRGALRNLDLAKQLALGPGGPAAYAETLASEQLQLAAACQAPDLEPMRRALQAVDFRTLPRVKAGAGDPEVQARVKRLRDAAKKTVSAYRDPRSLDSWLGNAEREAAALEELRATAGAMRALVELVADFEGAYQVAKKDRGAIDFADQERLALSLLRERDASGAWVPSQLACSLRSRVREVLVDEYQDINQVQDAILRMVCRDGPDQEPANLFMVGDPKQSIYRFRHADPALFRNRYRTYSPAGPGPRRIDLARNFRSRAEVVEAANFFFRQILTEDVGQMPYDAAAELVCGATYPELDAPVPVELHVISAGAGPAASIPEDEGTSADADDTEEGDDRQIAAARQREARRVADRIRQLMGLEGAPAALVRDHQSGALRPLRFKDAVILLRAANTDGQVFADELLAAGVPAHAQAKSGYFGALEVQTMLALLEVLDNPRQDILLAGTLRSPLFDGKGLTAADLACIKRNRDGDFYDAVRAAAGLDRDPVAGSSAPADGEVTPELRAALATFLDRLDTWRTRARRGPLGQLVWQIYQETGFIAHAAGLPGGEQRRANLLALHDRAREFDRFERQGLSRFLRFIERLRAAGEDLGMAPALSEAADVVRVMSIHASKGLEFPVVFVCGLGKAFNEQDLRGDLLFDEGLGLGPKVTDSERRLKYPSLAHLAVRERLRQEGIAEEIRLLYVALTRAQERLVLVGSVRQFERKAERWAQAAPCAAWPLPADLLGQARSLLDLLGMALARHREGATIRRIGGATGPVDPTVQAAPALIAFKLVPAADLDRPVPANRLPAADLDPLAALPDPLEGSLADLVARLSWRYPYAEAAKLPAKISVTEAAKRLRDQAERDSVPLEDWLARWPDGQEPRPDGAEGNGPDAPARIRKPRFMQDSSSALTPAERGTAAHLFMQHLDFARRPDRAALDRQLATMVASELLTPEMAGAVPIAAIESFLGQPLAERLQAAAPDTLWRELPFSMAVLPDEVGAGGEPDRASASPHVEAADETLLLQGVIDAILVELDGLVVVDWKTDSPRGRTTAQMAEPHLAQIALYRRAARAMFGQRVKAAYLVFLQTGQVHAVNE